MDINPCIQFLTPCQVSGHLFCASDTFPVLNCRDCDASYEDEESYNASQAPEALDVLWPGVSGESLDAYAQKALAAKAKGETEYPPRVFVITDQERLREALENLDNNPPPVGFMKWLRQQEDFHLSAVVTS